MIKVNKDFTAIPKSLLQDPPKIGDDVKLRLNDIYNSKCCYCETKVEGEVEHFYPKSKFPNKEFDWDNLLWACNKCNKYKSNSFDIDTKTEIPLLVNPEKENPESLLSFKKDGSILSENSRMTYSIDTCKLNREWLKNERKAVFDKLKNIIKASKYFDNKDLTTNEVMNHIVKPINENPKLSYLAFRKYFVKHWLRDILEN